MTKLNTLNEYLRAPYTRVIVPDEDGRYVAEILEFEGCVADGETEAQALKNLAKVTKAWVSARLSSGMFIPEAFGMPEMSGRFALRLPQSLHSKVAVYAEREGVSMNTFVVNSLAGSVGALDFIDRYAKQLMEVSIYKVTLNLEVRGTIGMSPELMQPQPLKIAGTAG